ncbi:hypothetical protein [Schaalia cardiffensis]|uniref:hypothetical protein n=1 Tax=Schaalia cardiffensis TaxID=181487 RepID=UPI0023F209B5|nr:hypothetical protein [Schaalia cardiffensis]
MNGLVFDEARHRYTLDGKPVPGVTSILSGGLPKPGLTWWAAKTVAETAVLELSRLSSDVEAGRTEDAVKWLKSSPFKERDRAAARGTAVHALAEQVVAGLEVDVPVDHANLVAGYVDFLDDNDVEPLLVEAKVASRAHWYAGTADLFATMGGQTWLFDLKTSRSVHGSYFLQLAAYAMADFYLDADGAEQPVPLVDRIGVIHVTEEGSRLYEGPPVDEAFSAFQAVKQVASLAPVIDGWAPKNS